METFMCSVHARDGSVIRFAEIQCYLVGGLKWLNWILNVRQRHCHESYQYCHSHRYISIRAKIETQLQIRVFSDCFRSMYALNKRRLYRKVDVNWFLTGIKCSQRPWRIGSLNRGFLARCSPDEVRCSPFVQKTHFTLILHEPYNFTSEISRVHTNRSSSPFSARCSNAHHLVESIHDIIII